MNSDANELRSELERLREENAELRKLLSLSIHEPSRNYQQKFDPARVNTNPIGSLTADSPAVEKIALFRNLFRGRDDVFAL